MEFVLNGTFWALIPAIVAIVLALCTKEVYSSLFIGIIIGGIFFAIDSASGFPGFFQFRLSLLTEVLCIHYFTKLYREIFY